MSVEKRCAYDPSHRFVSNHPLHKYCSSRCRRKAEYAARRAPATVKRCAYDGCHTFTPASSSHVYCHDCGCQRVVRSLKSVSPETYVVDERVRVEKARRVIQRNRWILRNRRIAFFDIETSNLSASIGEILCAVVKPLRGEPKVFRSAHSDADFLEALRDELASHDFIVTFYGSRFDLPFLFTRLKSLGLKGLGPYRHIDLYYYVRYYLRLHSNRQQVVAETLFGKSYKTRILGRVWESAVRGDQPSLDYIVDHCIKDTKELERIFLRCIGFVNLGAVRVRLFE